MISTRFNVDRWHAQTRGPKSNQQTEMANAHINEQGQWPSKAATKLLQLDNAGGNCLPLVNNSTYHRRILDWKTQRRTHPAPQARINKNTFEWRCPLSVPIAPLPCSGLQSIEKVFMFISRWGTECVHLDRNSGNTFEVKASRALQVQTFSSGGLSSLWTLHLTLGLSRSILQFVNPPFIQIVKP